MGRAETLWIEEVQRGRITEAWKTQFTLFQDGAGSLEMRWEIGQIGLALSYSTSSIVAKESLLFCTRG